MLGVMAKSRRDIALAIGVADAKPLPYLQGAVNGARSFHNWATQIGYDSRLLTDEDEPVTVARLRFALEAALKPTSRPIHRLLIYFAGHGLIREAEEGLWLLSDWNDELKAVAVEVLRRRLYMHDIQQIAIFADSCRTLPPNITAADLAPDPVLGRGPMREPKQPAIDKFIAAQDGSATFMVPGTTPHEDRCLFSGLLLEGLWGTRSEAFSKLVKNKVTSRSLGAYLDTEVPRLAERYKRKLFPSTSPTFPEGDDIYFGDGSRPTPPAFPPWPPPEVFTAGVPHIELGQSGAFEAERGIGRLRSRRSDLVIEKIRTQAPPFALESGTGIGVEGGSVHGFWTTADLLADKDSQSNWWQVRTKSTRRLVRPAPLLIEFKDDLFAAITVLPGFIARVLREERGILALTYSPAHESQDTATAAALAIATMESGALRSDAATNLAFVLRQKKHVDPVLGVISAYLYDSIGDLDSIRRMAYYYVEHSQPIPYDIALLGQLPAESRDGLLKAKVPAVHKREPRTAAERSKSWTYSATPATTGYIAGFWPWMRQGWTFLDDPAEDGPALVHPGLTALIRYLVPARFATLDSRGVNWPKCLTCQTKTRDRLNVADDGICFIDPALLAIDHLVTSSDLEDHVLCYRPGPREGQDCARS
jgi:hypothetical protein